MLGFCSSLKDLGDPFCFVFQVVLKNLAEPSCLVFEVVSRMSAIPFVLKKFKRILRIPCACFLK